jgi:hypothetical protein
MSDQAAMRRKILDALAYPRQVAKANVRLSTCPHSGFFEVMDSTCQQCSKNYECDWLNSTDQFHDLAGRPMEFLYRALTFGIDYVDAQVVRQEHNADSCECNSCEWIRNARDLIQEYSERPTQNLTIIDQEERT